MWGCTPGFKNIFEDLWMGKCGCRLTNLHGHLGSPWLGSMAEGHHWSPTPLGCLPPHLWHGMWLRQGHESTQNPLPSQGWWVHCACGGRKPCFLPVLSWMGAAGGLGASAWYFHTLVFKAYDLILMSSIYCTFRTLWGGQTPLRNFTWLSKFLLPPVSHMVRLSEGWTLSHHWESKSRWCASASMNAACGCA